MASQKEALNGKTGLPVGRLVQGNLYKGNDKDADGKPRVVKSGPNQGQPTVQFFFALAILKGAEKHWAETAWGSIIWRTGHTEFPQAAQRQDFAWKVEDGDSTVLNKKNRRPCDQEGYPGHWILKFTGGFAPKVYRVDNGAFTQVLDQDFVKPGYFVEVAGNVVGNGSQQNPGVFLNPESVCFRAYGPEIVFGSSPEDAGFGAAPLPAGATATPPPSANPIPAPPTAATTIPAVTPPPPPPPVPVMPNTQFLQVQPPVNPTSAPTAVVPQPVPVISATTASPSKMTAKANGASYQSFIAGGWDDANLIAQGYMTV